MNKRDFLTQGSVMATGVVSASWLPSAAKAQAAAHPGEADLSAWQARLGQPFEARSPLGRHVPLRLVEVTPLTRPHTKVEQFCLNFEGPRHLPLGEGLHALQGADNTVVHLHLQPVRSADGLRYQAHFSLLG